MTTEEQKMSAEQQYAYERAFQKHNEHIFKTTCAYMKSIQDKNAYLIELEPNSTEFLQFVGSVCYLIGLDFYTTVYPNKKVMKNVSQRLEDTIFSTEEDFNKKLFINNIFDLVESLDCEKFEELYQGYIKSVEDRIPFSEFDAVGRINSRFHKIMAGSTINVSYAKSISDILNKKTSDLTYKDILTINNTITDYLDYVKSRTMDEFSAMYTDNNFRELLKKSAVRYDRLKFGTIYNESVMSMRDIIISKRYDKDFVIDLLTDNVSDEMFDAVEEKYQKELELKKAQEPENKDERPERIYEKHVNDINDLMKSDPLYAMFIIVHEQYDEDEMTTPDAFVKGLDVISKNEDYIGQVYHYLQSIKNKINKDSNIGEYEECCNGLIEKLDENIQELRKQYKEQTEFVCQDIEPNLCSKINRQINSVIRNMVLSTNEQKQYLISQLNFPGVKTVKHLTEIMHVIESGKINASLESIEEYNKLFNTVREGLGDVLDKISSQTPVEDRLALYMVTKDILTRKFPKSTEDK